MARVSDPIADMLTRLRNAIKAGHLKTDVPSSNLKVSIARILKDEGFIKNFNIIDDKKQKPNTKEYYTQDCIGCTHKYLSCIMIASCKGFSKLITQPLSQTYIKKTEPSYN